MITVATRPRSPEQRAAENERYNDRRAAAGLVKLHVPVPIVRLQELDPLLVGWRHDAKASLEKDQPTADQILMIHTVYRALRIKLPIGAFATRYTADDWLRDRQPRLGDDLPHLPRARSVT